MAASLAALLALFFAVRCPGTTAVGPSYDVISPVGTEPLAGAFNLWISVTSDDDFPVQNLTVAVSGAGNHAFRHRQHGNAIIPNVSCVGLTPTAGAGVLLREFCEGYCGHGRTTDFCVGSISAATLVACDCASNIAFEFCANEPFLRVTRSPPAFPEDLPAVWFANDVAPVVVRGSTARGMVVGFQGPLVAAGYVGCWTATAADGRRVSGVSTVRWSAMPTSADPPEDCDLARFRPQIMFACATAFCAGAVVYALTLLVVIFVRRCLEEDDDDAPEKSRQGYEVL